jgi:hypothetical protein
VGITPSPLFPFRRPSRPKLPRRALPTAGALVAWYFEVYYGKAEGPGCLPFYCDPAMVGAFAVAPEALARGDEDAVFRLALGIAMYQARKDQDVMAIQRALPAEEAKWLLSPGALRAALAQAPCAHAGDVRAFHRGCDVRKLGPDEADCSVSPGAPCPVKRAALLLRRYGDFGKVPFSLARVGEGRGLETLSSLYEYAMDAMEGPRERAAWLEEALCRAWRVDRKIANYILSTLAHPHLAPGLAPWAHGLDWTYFVVVDRHVRRALIALGAPAKAPYEVYRAWLEAIARRIDLRHYHPDLAAYDPRLVQQALFRFGARANRRAEPRDCCHRGPAACQACPAHVARRCPLRVASGVR